jgi:predicted RNA-binding protein with PIN domain
VNYFLDGYNILFTLTESDHPLATQRQKIIRFLQKQFSLFKMDGILVFDGRVHRDEESGRAYRSPLDIIYTPKGQSADQYIVERIETSENPRQITVVTNDRALFTNARVLGAKTTRNAEFIQWLMNRKKKNTGVPKPDITETRYNIDRLLVVFEKRLEEYDDD